MKKYLLVLFMMGVFFVLPGKQIFAENMVGSTDATKGTLIYSQDGVEIWEKIEEEYYTDLTTGERTYVTNPKHSEIGDPNDLFIDTEKTCKDENSAIETRFNTKDVKGDAVKVATFDNRQSDGTSSFTYKETHKYSCTKSVNGSADVKALETALGVEYNDEYTKEISYTFNVPARQAYNLWIAPTGKKYTWVQYWVSPSQPVGSGEYTNWTGIKITPVKYD